MGFNLGDVLKNVSNLDTAKKQIVELPCNSRSWFEPVIRLGGTPSFPATGV